MSDATNPAVVPDAQRYDWREDWNLTQTRIGYDQDAIVDAMHRLAAHIERLEAERDALLAEHEAWEAYRAHEGRQRQWDDAWAAHDNAERVSAESHSRTRGGAA